MLCLDDMSLNAFNNNYTLYNCVSIVGVSVGVVNSLQYGGGGTLGLYYLVQEGWGGDPSHAVVIGGEEVRGGGCAHTTPTVVAMVLHLLLIALEGLQSLSSNNNRQ